MGAVSSAGVFQQDSASNVATDAASSGDTPTADNAICSGFQQYATQGQEDRVDPYLVDASAETDLGQDESYGFQAEGDVQDPPAYSTPYAWDSISSAGQDLRTSSNYDGPASRWAGPEFELPSNGKDIVLHDSMSMSITVNYDQGDDLYSWPHQGFRHLPSSSAAPREGIEYVPPGHIITNWPVSEPARSGSTSRSEGMWYGDGAYYPQPGGSWQSGNAN